MNTRLDTPLPESPVDKTKPLAEAVRLQLIELVESEVLELDTLKAIAQVSENGRALVAVRDPMARFDARAEGHTSSIPGGPAFGECEAYDMGMTTEDLGTWAKGPMGREHLGKMMAQRTEMLKTSPVLNALRVELLEVLAKTPFEATHLLQVEQLAIQGHRVMSSALGITAENDSGGRRRRGSGSIVMGSNYSGMDSSNSWAPSSSAETFGANLARQVVSMTGQSGSDNTSIVDLAKGLAVARKEGLTDLAASIETKLEGQGLRAKPAEEVTKS